ncbi:HAMP domain-containing sensor histidine kinase [Clostridium sp. AWRP]|uniref:HAMP domain-containing sensor histidine kinase n=1 Tax=Clostridium sp. AWRP TaxID=2212991 RepID=UPI000FDAF2B0|nr:HAMP domain-containing sensor histidine kinase [Clostridium sp. AWRP]AZV57803.2 GHKL domain-containing protein [Clostridium sp. AWRP]
MKINFNITKKKLGVKSFLIINCLITFLILYVIIQLSYKSSTLIVKKFIFKDQQISNVAMAFYYNEDFDKIKLGALSEMGAWEEVLNEDKKVIYVKGEKKDNIMQYTEEQLFRLSSVGNYSPQNPYFGEVFSVKGKHGEPYVFLYKIDRRKLTLSFTYKPNLYTKADSLLSFKVYGVLYLIQFLYLLIGLYIYSRISSKFITNPLKTFVHSIKNLKKLDYATRTNVKGLKELQEVENEFNEMVIELEKVKEENKRIDASKKRLLVDISHDLKTPITSIQGFSKLLLEENVTLEEKNKFLKIIHNKSVYSTELIEDLFALSKLEDSEYSPSLVKLNFTEWLRRLIVEYYEEFQNKHFNLDINISEYPIVFKFDEKLMKRAISNILNNALNHNESYTKLKIVCYLKNNNVILEIGNDGESIDKSIRDAIFEPFVKNSSSGSGLGLAITKKIIEKHGGTIKLTSTEFEKNLFVISIPLKF